MTFELRQPPPPNNLLPKQPSLQTIYALSIYLSTYLSTYLPIYLHSRRRRPHRHAYRMATPPQSGP